LFLKPCLFLPVFFYPFFTKKKSGGGGDETTGKKRQIEVTEKVFLF